jgi:hypothetical protein
MKNLWILVFVCAISCSTQKEDPYAACVPEISQPAVSTQNGLFEGDILIPQTKGVVKLQQDLLWEFGVVPYYFREDNNDGFASFSKPDKDNIRQALKELQTATGILFLEYASASALREQHHDGIVIDVGAFNSSSYLGKQGGIQSLKIVFPGSTASGLKAHRATTIHEFCHALGMLHEHSRSDRDAHIIVHYDNIYENYHRQFERQEGVINCGGFDLKSIMMYGSFHFAIDDSRPAMTLLDGQTFERNYELSPGDIRTLQALYSVEINKRNKTK